MLLLGQSRAERAELRSSHSVGSKLDRMTPESPAPRAAHSMVSDT
jgi:hypothetical protein